MKQIKVTFYYDGDKKSETVEVPIHHSLMEASKYYSKDNYIPGIEADCGGSCACCTCHIHLTDKWVDKLGKIDYNGLETSLMEYEKNYVEGVSRLACQIKLQPEHDGLIVNLLKHELL